MSGSNDGFVGRSDQAGVPRLLAGLIGPPAGAAARRAAVLGADSQVAHSQKGGSMRIMRWIGIAVVGVIALLMLVWSVICASYPTWNPWTPPLLHNFLGYLN